MTTTPIQLIEYSFYSVLLVREPGETWRIVDGDRSRPALEKKQRALIESGVNSGCTRIIYTIDDEQEHVDRIVASCNEELRRDGLLASPTRKSAKRRGR